MVTVVSLVNRGGLVHTDEADEGGCRRRRRAISGASGARRAYCTIATPLSAPRVGDEAERREREPSFLPALCVWRRSSHFSTRKRCSPAATVTAFCCRGCRTFPRCLFRPPHRPPLPPPPPSLSLKDTCNQPVEISVMFSEYPRVRIPSGY